MCLIDVILVSRRNKRKIIFLHLKHGLKKRFHLDVSIPISLITWLINIRDVTLTNYPRSLLNFPFSKFLSFRVSPTRELLIINISETGSENRKRFESRGRQELSSMSNYLMS